MPKADFLHIFPLIHQTQNIQILLSGYILLWTPVLHPSDHQLQSAQNTNNLYIFIGKPIISESRTTSLPGTSERLLYGVSSINLQSLAVAPDELKYSLPYHLELDKLMSLSLQVPVNKVESVSTLRVKKRAGPSWTVGGDHFQTDPPVNVSKCIPL